MKAAEVRESVCHVEYTLDIFDQHRFERKQSCCKSIAMKTCKRNERKLGVSGLAPETFLRPRPLERRKTHFCKVEKKLLASLVFMSVKDS